MLPVEKLDTGEVNQRGSVRNSAVARCTVGRLTWYTPARWSDHYCDDTPEVGYLRQDKCTVSDYRAC